MKSPKLEALIAGQAIWQPEALTPTRLKSATLLFDQLTFVNQPEADLADIILSDDAREGKVSAASRNKLAGRWVSTLERAPMFSPFGDHRSDLAVQDRSQWPWHAAPESLKSATKAALNKLYDTNIDSKDPPASDYDSRSRYEAYKYGGYVMSDILFWQKYFPSSVYVGNDISEGILRSLGTEIAAPQRAWADIAFPDFNSLSWDDVSELLASPYLSHFREKFFALSAAGDVSRLTDEYREALEDLSDRCRPALKRNVIVGVLGNIPGLPINPVAVGGSIYAVAQDIKLNNDFGWTFFVRDLQKATRVKV